jgi:membrane protein
LGLVPSYSAVYGAFATFPILLVWIYVAWVILLLGAVIAAYLPSLLRGVARQGGTPGWQFQLAVELLQQLAAARRTPVRGLHLHQLADRLETDALQLMPVLEVLVALDWVARLDEQDAVEEKGSEARFVLLADAAMTPLEPLLQRLLLPCAPSLEKAWQAGRWRALLLRDVL